MSGRVVHFEIPYDDQERAQTFYAQAFGWDLNPLPQMSYTLVEPGPTGDQGPTEPGYIGGGMMSRSDSPSPGPTLLIDVGDIAASPATTQASGGEPGLGPPSGGA